MQRVENWPFLLHSFFEKRAAIPFAWGTHDCALTACDWIHALTGIDPAASLRGRYHTALGAARIIKRHGGLLSIADDACALNGWPACPVLMARRGDIVAMDTIHGPALGICDGARAAFPAADGLAYFDLNQCRRGWRIA